MDTLIAMFFTLGMMGGAADVTLGTTPVETPSLQTVPERNLKTIELRRQQILAINAWSRELRKVAPRHSDSTGPVQLALGTPLPGS